MLKSKTNKDSNNRDRRSQKVLYPKDGEITKNIWIDRKYIADNRFKSNK